MGDIWGDTTTHWFFYKVIVRNVLKILKFFKNTFLRIHEIELFVLFTTFVLISEQFRQKNPVF